MNVYPHDIEQKIGFDKIRALVAKHCQSALGKSYAQNAQLLTTFKKISKLLEQTHIYTRLLQECGHLTYKKVTNLDELLQKATIENAYLSESELHQVRLTLQTLEEVTSVLSQQEHFDILYQLIVLDEDPQALLLLLNKMLDENGELVDHASAELAKIRKQIQQEQRHMRKNLQRFLDQAKADGYAEEHATLGIRDERMVIPIIATYKRKIQGFVHDESASGRIVYLEPTIILDANNLVRELRYQEKREVIRILTELTVQVHANKALLTKATQRLGLLDYIQGKALFAQKIDATYPNLVDKPILQWKKAMHPLLYLMHLEKKKPTIPQDITLNDEQRLILLSGPNAGGKSVTLKTVALGQFMLQHGMLIPVAEQSQAGVFKQFFMDIGDDQSLEDDLSTYSSHLTHMKHFLVHSQQHSLVLIDEFGTGTDPQYGGAIAEGILSQLIKRNCYGVMTTHYGNLKEFAEQHASIQNAAMRYDTEKLSPKYELEIGQPGSSFALEIAQKIGLPKAVLTYAKAKIGKKRISKDINLSKLQQEKEKYQQLAHQLIKEKKEAEKQRQKYEELIQTINKEKKNLRKKAALEAQAIIDNASKTVEQTIKAIKMADAEKEKTKAARENLEREKQQIKKEIQVPIEPKKPVKLIVGDMVTIDGQEASGTIIQIKNKVAEVQFGLINAKIPIDQLTKVGHTQTTQNSTTKHSHLKKIQEKSLNFKQTLDLRGKRAEEIHGLLTPYMDEAIMLGIDAVRILHGKGNGVLKDVCRTILRDYQNITFADESIEQGGAGVTVVRMG